VTEHTNNIEITQPKESLVNSTTHTKKETWAMRQHRQSLV